MGRGWLKVFTVTRDQRKEKGGEKREGKNKKERSKRKKSVGNKDRVPTP